MPENESSDAQMNYQDPLFLSHSDNHDSSLTLMLFDGGNFMIWSRIVKLALGAKNKKGFIEGKIPKPASGHKDYNRWERSDYMVRCWIFRYMTDQVAGDLSLVQTSKQLWDELSERYSESNIPLLYQLKKDLGKLEQEDLSVGDYYCKLKKFWDEIYNIKAMPECTCGIVAKCTCSMYKKMLSMVETKRLIQFLMGLNRGYQNVRENILSMDPLPSVNKAFHLVQQTKKQKKVSGDMQDIAEASTFQLTKEVRQYVSAKQNDSRNQGKEGRKPKTDVFCDHCKKKGHDRSGCFEIYGYPHWYKGKRTAENFGKLEEEIDSSLDEEEYEIGSGSMSKPDAGMISAVVKEVMRAF
ncbi:uncharacterized protein LOC110710936 [Chenopodium quinoa]|uniref:uncharacterized protein LOC110710936 n=1 Tax=Chenopodium quinoa TaxID=63459 RepID=UPI000B788333|nr:uncharacterized protein LOC110710936 [Chenopodium quinoa]